jgi:hypothetical protein
MRLKPRGRRRTAHGWAPALGVRGCMEGLWGGGGGVLDGEIVEVEPRRGYARTNGVLKQEKCVRHWSSWKGK